MKSIYQYRNYREWLNDFYLHLKKKDNISLRKLADQVGFSSHTFFKQVVDGERNLSSESVEKIAIAFGLTEIETQFFQNLVHFNHSDDNDVKTRYYHAMLKNIPLAEPKNLEDSQYALFSEWYHIAILELCAHPNWQGDLSWLEGKLNPPVASSKIESSLKLLVELNLLQKNSDGFLAPTDQLISTGNEIGNLAVVEYHRKLLELANQSISSVEQDWRDLSVTAMIVDREEFHFIKEEMQNFRKRILAYLADRDHGNLQSAIDTEKELYCLNMQLFPQTVVNWKTDQKK